MADKDKYGLEYWGTSLHSCPADCEGAVVIKDGTETICKDAFKDCAKIASVELPHSIRRVEKNAFVDANKSLHTIRYNGTLEEWLNLDWASVLNNWYDLYFNDEKLIDATVPTSITDIRSLAFYNSSLKSVKFLGDIVSFGDSAFNKSCLNGDYRIPDTVVKIGHYCFLSCKSLTSVYIPESVISIGDKAFRYCDKMRSVDVAEENPNYCSENGILYNKQKTVLIYAPSVLTGTIVIPSTVIRIEDDAFTTFNGDCKIIISGSSIREIGKDAFKDTINLTIVVDEDMKDYFVKLGIPETIVIEKTRPKVYDSNKDILPFNKVINNPFRILGVFVNASAKDVASSQNKIKRYVDVGKEPVLDADFKEFLPTVQRDISSVEKANSSIYLPKDKIKAALFWFAKTEPYHEIALNHAKAGNFSKAYEILSKDNSWASVLDRATLSFSTGSFGTALENAYKLICEDSLRLDLVSSVCGQNYTISASELSIFLIEEMLVNLEALQVRILLDKCPGRHPDAINYLTAKIISSPIGAIESAINKAKEADPKNATDSYKAGLQLMYSTKQTLAELQKLSSFSKTRVENCIDNLAKQILQCGINYYNSSEEYEAAQNAMVLQEYAESIAVGSLAKERCKKNVDILRNILNNLPSKAVFEFERQIRGVVEKYSQYSNSCDNAIQMLKQCAPILINAKEAAGKSDESYLKLSQRVIESSLNKVITEVNNRTGSLNKATYFNRESLLQSLKTCLREAWRAILMMEKMDMSTDYKKNRFTPNKTTLQSLVNSANVSVYDISANLDMRTEQEFFNDCHSIEEYQSYLKKYEKPRFGIEANDKIRILTEKKKKSRTIKWIVFLSILAILSGVICYFIITKESRLYSAVESQESLEACETYLERCPDGEHVDNVINIMSKKEGEYVRKYFTTNLSGYQLTSSADIFQLLSRYETYKKVFPDGEMSALVADYVDVNTQTFDYDKLNYQSTAADYEAFFKNHTNQDGPSYKDAEAEYERKFDWEKYKDSRLNTGAQPYRAAYGSNKRFGYYSEHSTISVIAPTGSDVVVIIKCNSESGPVAGHAYIRSGEMASIDLYNGTYKPIFYYGNGWKPTKQKVEGAPGGFVKDESYSTIDGTEYLYNQEVTYTLQMVRNGNLHTRSLSEGSAF